MCARRRAGLLCVEPTIVKARQADEQLATAASVAAISLKRLQAPFRLERLEVDRLCHGEEAADGIDPACSHGLDVGSFLGDMAVFRRVVLADNQMRHVRGEIVLVRAA